MLLTVKFTLKDRFLWSRDALYGLGLHDVSLPRQCIAVFAYAALHVGSQGRRSSIHARCVNCDESQDGLSE
eukprot:4998510-Pleurochrysis_carterae.AAC.1